MISPSVRSQIRREFEKLENPISLKVFTSEIHCPACADTIELCETLTEITDKITFEKVSLDTQEELAAKYGVEYTPTIRIESGGELTGIRYTGIPAGGEFAAFIHTLVMVSTQTTELGHLKEKLMEIKKPVVVRTVVTPTTGGEKNPYLWGIDHSAQHQYYSQTSYPSNLKEKSSLIPLKPMSTKISP